MGKRQLVQISEEQVKKLKSIDSFRPDLAGYPVSKKVAFLLHEKLSETFLRKDALLQKPQEKVNWLEYIREPVPLHVLAPILFGATRYSKQAIGASFSKILYAVSSEKTWWGEDAADVEIVGSFLLKNLANKSFADEYFAHYHLLCSEVEVKSAKIKNSDLSALSNQRLAELYVQFLELTKNFHALTFDIDAMDVVMEGAIKSALKQSAVGVSERELALKYNVLVTPISMSYVTEEQLLVYALAQKIKQDQKLSKLFELDTKIILQRLSEEKQVMDSINKIVEKYWWTGLGWATMLTKNTETIVSDLKNVIRETPNIGHEINRMKEFPITALADRKKELSLLKNKKLEALLEIFDKYVKLHDLRKEGQMKSTYSMNLLLLEIARRHSVKFSDLSWAWPDEIEALLKTGHFDVEKASMRRESLFTIVYSDGIEECTGEKATARRKQEFSQKMENLRDFRGVAASMGRVSGKVKVCFSSTDAIAKIEKGDILVASMTLPDYVPAMKKAAAIITDEGGVTCHAAIVSRELKIPCLVGTKIATKVLSDGDMVDVNANHALVIILSSKNA